MTSWPWNLVCFDWLSKDYLVFRLQLHSSISYCTNQRHFWEKNCQWPWPLYTCFIKYSLLVSFYRYSAIAWRYPIIVLWEKNTLYNFIKIVENRHKAHFVAQYLEKFQIWNLEAKTFSTSYYTTIFDDFHFQGCFKVMATFDLDDLMTLKPSIFWLAIQGLPCIPIAAL